jgi:hypothetical protein
MDTLVQMATAVENKIRAEREQGVVPNTTPDNFSRHH